MDCYIIKDTFGRFHALYHRDGNIYYREKEDDTWTYPQVIGTEARESFTASCGNEITAVYQTVKGDIAIGAKDKKSRILLKNRESRSVIIHCIAHGEHCRLIYNSPMDAVEDYMTEQHRREDKTWSTSIAIDNYIASTARLHNIEKGSSYIMLYVKRAPEYQLGYREISPKGMGRFKMLYATGYKITDYSAVITDEAIHLSIITGSGRGSRVIYISKTQAGISQPIFLSESPAQCCVTGIVQNKLYVWWKTQGGVYRAVSYNMGTSFRKGEFCKELANCRKSAFINMGESDPNTAVFTDMLTDKDRVYESLLI